MSDFSGFVLIYSLFFFFRHFLFCINRSLPCLISGLQSLQSAPPPFSTVRGLTHLAAHWRRVHSHCCIVVVYGAPRRGCVVWQMPRGVVWCGEWRVAVAGKPRPTASLLPHPLLHQPCPPVSSSAACHEACGATSTPSHPARTFRRDIFPVAATDLSCR